MPVLVGPLPAGLRTVPAAPPDTILVR
jgi:hypothetical protein